MRISLLVLIFSLISKISYGQQTYYTQFQAGGNIGLWNPGYKGTFNGYSVHFIFGRNINERAFLGIGLGNETLKGDYQSKDQFENDPKKYKYNRSLFPVFLDARLPIMDFGTISRLGIFANAGYAPRIGAIYDQGGLLKMGLFYLNDSFSRRKFTLSASYGLQELKGNFYNEKFYHQQINISIGLLLK